MNVSNFWNEKIDRVKKLPIALFVASTVLGTGAQADTVFGIFGGVDLWNSDSSGSFGSSRTGMQDFNLDNENKVSFSIALEHPMPIIPNFRLRTSDLSTSGDTTLSADFEFAGKIFDEDTTVATEFKLQNTDITLYYELFDNDVVSFDLGLTGKYLDGEFKVVNKEDSGSATESFKGIVPLLYGAVQIGVPTTGFTFFGELSALSIDDNKIQDYQAGVAYSFLDNLAIDMSVRAGYREFSLELDDLDNVFTDWSFDGPFLGVEAHF